MTATSSSDDALKNAGNFAAFAIQTYINEIHAASYPQTPQQVGGEPYMFFKERFDEVAALIGSGDKLSAREKSIQAVRDFLELQQNAGEAGTHAYERFTIKAEVVDRLLAGESLEAVKDSYPAVDGVPADAPGQSPNS